MASTKTVAFSHLHVQSAQLRSIDVTRAAKQNRDFIRRNFDTLVKAWPELRSSHKQNRDKSTYPATVPVDVGKAIVTRNLNVITSQRVAKQRTPKEALVNHESEQ